MKIMCKSHGCHFPDEFNQTLEFGCSLWRDLGFEDLSLPWKQKLWKWNFAINWDALYLEEGYLSWVTFGGQKVDKPVNQFEEDIPGYASWSDEKRRRYQKELFKRQQKEAALERLRPVSLVARLKQAYAIIRGRK